MIYDTSTGYDDPGCCQTAAPEPIAPPYEPPAAIAPPSPLPAPTTTWLDEPESIAPAPLVIEPAPIAVQPAPIEPAPVEPAPIEPAPVEPAPIEPAPVEPAPLVITADPAAATSLYPGSSAVDTMLAEAHASLGPAPAMPVMPGGMLLPVPGNPSLWDSTPGHGGLFPTSDADRDGIDNASDAAPFTPAPRHP